jgi:hypothetical protein
MAKTTHASVALAAAIAVLVPQAALASTVVTFDFNGIISPKTAIEQIAQISAFSDAQSKAMLEFDVPGAAGRTMTAFNEAIGVDNGGREEGVRKGFTFDITVGGVYTGFVLDHISFDLCSTGSWKADAYAGANRLGTSGENNGTTGNSDCDRNSGSWTHFSTASWASGTVDKLEFTPSLGTIWLDNLTLDLLSGGTTLPEPASIGLSALALGAAGLASRRRRKTC